MRTYKIHHVDSFTKTLFGGNPTVAVLGADSLSDTEMKKIAREMNLSETGFILASKKANFRVRFFTPSGNEVKFCGHATLGALCAVAKERLFGCVHLMNELSIETNAGILHVKIDLSQAEPHYIFDAPKIDLVPVLYGLDEIVQGLGISRHLLDESKAALVEKTNSYLYLAARDLESLGKIQIDFQRAVNFVRKENIVVFCILTKGAFEDGNHFHARGFAPLIGVPEDPFTGSMQGGLAAYAWDQGMLPPTQTWIHVEQGHFMGRPGFVKLERTQVGPLHIRLHCEAVHVFESELRLPG